MTAAYRVELACPRCGRELDHEATSRPSDLGRRMSAVPSDVDSPRGVDQLSATV